MLHDPNETNDISFPTLSDYRARWFGIFVLLTLATIFVVAFRVANPHKPSINWPKERSDQVAELRVLSTNGQKPVNAAYLEEVLKAYKLEPCVIGEKYGAYCQDGTWTYDSDAEACTDQGGVKEWITCR